MTEKLYTLQPNTLKNTKYYVKTSLLKTTDHYSDTEKFPVYGTGQDSKDSGVNRTFITIPIIEVIDKQTREYSIRNPKKTKILNKKI